MSGVRAGDGRLALLAAGGTGGHLFPAQALAEELGQRGWHVHLATDARGGRFRDSFPAEAVHVLPAATVGARSPLALAKTAWTLMAGFFAAWSLIGRIKPSVAVGFGGYPTVPPILAAWARRVETCVHEQNAIMGRANRLLKRFVTAIAVGFPDTALVSRRDRWKVTHTGVPVRAAVVAAAARRYDKPDARGEFRLLVFGGSQGARVFADVVPEAVAGLSEEARGRLEMVQQARPEDMERVSQAYDGLGVKAEVAPFFADLPARIAAAHLVISRSGASTATELTVIGRPAILVPLPGAIDNDQLMNATALEHREAAWLMPQSAFTPEFLAQELERLMGNPEQLWHVAAAARALGRPDAVARLADLVDALAKGRRAMAAPQEETSS
ncbi:MAG: undecaprenyldiphospho-muramoylpentapeptide beta-N-acetylglucosaminyltransferase [Hyphomicrobiales bacterium]|nr:undecaprenyldiphospho-muramoylpentapeptide beta-N-acetylglucosaminyltransferase [Hyphomicrobiales bacterium]